MTTTSAHPFFHSLNVSSAISEALSALPAVATIDWGDRAAQCLTFIADEARVCIILGTVDGSGSLLGQEAAGVAIAPPRRRVAGEAAARPGMGAAGAGPSTSLEHETVRTLELTLRSKAERLGHLGFRPSEQMLQRGVVAPIARLIEGQDWRSGPLGQLWSGLGVGDLVVGLHRLGGTEPGRVLYVQVGMPGDERVQVQHVGLLRAVMPLLLRRALLAIGPRRSTTSRWLTSREQQVLEELKLGKSVRQIAEQLERSPHTVHDHVKSLHRKLNASSRGELVARALGYLDEAGTVYDEPAAAVAHEEDGIMTLFGTGQPQQQAQPAGGQPSPQQAHQPTIGQGQTAGPAGETRPGQQKAQPLHRPDVIVPNRMGQPSQY